MRSLLTLVTLLAPTVLGVAHVKRYNGDKIPGRYIVKFNKPVASAASTMANILPESARILHNVFPGAACELSDDELEALRHNPLVESIFEDGMAHTQAIVTQTDAPWGLERISHTPKIVQHSDPLTYNYTREDAEGQGVDVYIVDTGLNIAHTQFEGRAKYGWAEGYLDAGDDNGHGTHVGGIVGSKQFGVAKKTHLIAVKVLNRFGQGPWSDVISGLDWVIQEVGRTGRPSVVNLSIGGDKYEPIDTAVQNVANAGIHIVVAAGNADSPISETSPGGAVGAITVGAVDINDVRADFSNYGPEIDVNAPGVDVISTYFGGDNEVATLSGTSMASPHVAGLVAYFISLNGNSSPDEMSDFIKNKAIKGAITGLKGDTPNLLAFNGIASLKRRGHVIRQNLHTLVERKSRRDRFLKNRAVVA